MSFFLFRFFVLYFSFLGGFGGFISVLISTFTFVFILFFDLFVEQQLVTFFVFSEVDSFHLHSPHFFSHLSLFISFVVITTVYNNNFVVFLSNVTCIRISIVFNIPFIISCGTCLTILYVIAPRLFILSVSFTFFFY